jgi:UDP-N-acetylmuramate dehydrogenase
VWLEKQCSKDKKLSEVSTFGIGGLARWFCEVKTIEELKEALQEARQHNIPYFILGKGSNTLFHDNGFDGLVIHNKISFFKQNENRFHVGAGYSFSLLGVQTARSGWSGLEFASGIPASVGGAVFMNAGANGKETCQHLSDVTYITSAGEVITFSKEELVFSYRSSSFQSMDGVIAAATFVLDKNEGARKEQLAIIDYRMQTQPYGKKSAGCVFRNPIGKSAGALIEQCGLKGEKIGGAEVSTLHANFIVNEGGATAQDVLDLANFVKEKVYTKTGIELELEVRFLT